MKRGRDTTRAARRSSVGQALGVYGAWTLATWLLEGRRRTLLRPEARKDRLQYVLVANLALGTGVAAEVLHRLVRRGTVSPRRAGARPRWPAVVSIPAAAGLGAGLYLLQRPTTRAPAVLLNAWNQTWTVSVPEVLVCWGLVSGAVESALAQRGRAASVAAGGAAGSLAFGLYHFAHSPPFSTWRMVAGLGALGLASYAFQAASRSLLATAVFHNFFAVRGVTRALERSGKLDRNARVQAPQLALAALTTGAAVAASARIRGAR